MKHKVFVYGTLKRGYGNHHWLLENNPAASFLNEAVAPGHTLLDIGAFPGMIPSSEDDLVIGEVFEIDNFTLAQMDGLEGFRKNFPDTSMYVRKTVSLLNGEEVFSYIWNRSTERYPVIGSTWPKKV